MPLRAAREEMNPVTSKGATMRGRATKTIFQRIFTAMSGNFDLYERPELL
jgi:hypothetical protein